MAEADMSLPEYKLSTVIEAHSGDVRGICAAGDQLVTCSRDLTAKSWRTVDGKTYALTNTFTGHSRYVLCVAFLPSTAEHPNGLIATGSLDQMINLYEPSVPQPVGQLSGHQNAVCCLHTDRLTGNLLSSSWDGSARVWDVAKRTCTSVLQSNHPDPQRRSMTCITSHPENSIIITGGAERVLRFWNGRDATAHKQVADAHADTIRALAVTTDPALLLSAGNDGMVKLWTFEGDALQTFTAHGNYIYGLAVLPGSGVSFATCSEAEGIKVWTNGELSQSLPLPCVSTWAVTATANGDIAVACDDSSVRVFTKSTERVAEDGILAMFESQVAAVQAARGSDSVGGINKSSLPDKSALETPGQRDGDVKLINNAGTVESYTWDALKGTWKYEGQVVDAPADEYQNFTIQLDDSGQSLTLRHKRGANPFESAKSFIQENNLDIAFMEQIADFIAKNADTPTFDTGLGASSAPATPAFSSQHFPNSAIVKFDTAKVPPMIKKLKEFNASADASAQVTEEEWGQLETGLTMCLGKSKIDDGVALPLLAVLEKLLSWPVDKVFPALDALRVALLSNEVVQGAFSDMPAHAGNALNRAVFVPTVIALGGIEDASAPVNNKMLAFRVLANAFTIEDGAVMLDSADEVLGAVKAADLSSVNANTLLAASTVLLNYAAVFKSHVSPENAEKELAAVQCIYGMLALESADDETIFRLLVALGTLATMSATLKEAIQQLPSLSPLLNKHKSSATAKVAGCAQDLSTLLQI